jgi:hypothetical protein
VCAYFPWRKSFRNIEENIATSIIHIIRNKEESRKNGSLGIWRAYPSPASLGLPLSVASACGRYEIYHLKCPHRSRYIVFRRPLILLQHQRPQPTPVIQL